MTSSVALQRGDKPLANTGECRHNWFTLPTTPKKLNHFPMWDEIDRHNYAFPLYGIRTLIKLIICFTNVDCNHNFSSFLQQMIFCALLPSFKKGCFMKNSRWNFFVTSHNKCHEAHTFPEGHTGRTWQVKCHFPTTFQTSCVYITIQW